LKIPLSKNKFNAANIVVLGLGAFVLVALIILGSFHAFYGSGSLLSRSTLSSAGFEGPETANVSETINLLKYPQSKLGTLSIRTTQEGYKKLNQKRNEALKEGLLLTSPDDYVPAKIEYGKSTYNAEIRLKGDQIGNIRDDSKWSFRIKILNGQTLFRMEKFSLHHPMARGGLYEWLFFQISRRENLVSPRYRFLKVRFNNNNLGIYALEEHFDKLLIEDNHFREGPIIKFNESLWWEARRREVPSGKKEHKYGSFYTSKIEAFREARVVKDPLLSEQFKLARTMLEKFRIGELSASDVFDTEKLAKFLALCDLFGAHHVIHPNNLRLYFNPLTQLLEPIPFDLDAGKKLSTIASGYTSDNSYAISLWEGNGRYLLLSKWFGDGNLSREYVRQLRRVSEKKYLDRLFKDLDPLIEENAWFLESEFSNIRFSKKLLYNNQLLIQKEFEKPKDIHVYFAKTDQGKLYVEAANITSLPIEIKKIVYKDLKEFIPGKPIVLPPYENHMEPLSYETIGFDIPRGMFWNDEMLKYMKVKYKILGTADVRSEELYFFPRIVETAINEMIDKKRSTITQFPFLKIDEKNKKIFVEKGDWIIEKDLIVPSGYSFHIRPGTTLRLSPNTEIISFSPLFCLGNADQPIIFISKDGGSGGVSVIGAGEVSVIEHTVFKDLSIAEGRNIFLTGAVTFYESPVNAAYCRFLDAKAEDSLNIIRSKFRIKNSTFENSASDALDVDFSNGEIIGSLFNDSANDAIDVSGSLVAIKGVRIKGSGDKGISAGEGSELEGQGLEISNAQIAIAAKDLSKVKIEKSKLKNSKIGIAAYQKKSEFGPASIILKKVKFQDIDRPHLIQSGSKALIDGKKIAGKVIEVQNIIENE